MINAAFPSGAKGGNISSSVWTAPPSRKNWRGTWNAAVESVYKQLDRLFAPRYRLKCAFKSGTYLLLSEEENIKYIVKYAKNRSYFYYEK